MKKQATLLSLCAGLLSTMAVAQTTVLTEDFSGATNIFGVSNTELTAGTTCIYDTGLDGYGKVLVVSNTTAEGTISSDGVATGDKVTDFKVVWDIEGFKTFFCKGSFAIQN